MHGTEKAFLAYRAINRLAQSSRSQPILESTNMSDVVPDGLAYRVFFLDEQGKIKKSKELKCMNDEEGISQARKLMDGRRLELFDQCRLVIAFPRQD
jgi:hypothetical protein